MIFAYHLTWTTYGHWFPNDPRGSWSDEVWQPQLACVRALDEERRVLRPHPVRPDRLQRFLNDARRTLVHPVVVLATAELKVVGEAFAEVAGRWNVGVLACAVLPDHAHLLVGRCASSHERLVNALKGRSSQRIREHRGIRPAVRRSERVPIWTVGYWVRYVPSAVACEQTAQYIDENPVKHGLPAQRWGFVEAL